MIIENDDGTILNTHIINEWDNEDIGEPNPEPSGHGHVCDTCGAQWDCFDMDCQPGLATCSNCMSET